MAQAQSGSKVGRNLIPQPVAEYRSRLHGEALKQLFKKDRAARRDEIAEAEQILGAAFEPLPRQWLTGYVPEPEPEPFEIDPEELASWYPDGFGPPKPEPAPSERDIELFLLAGGTIESFAHQADQYRLRGTFLKPPVPEDHDATPLELVCAVEYLAEWFDPLENDPIEAPAQTANPDTESDPECELCLSPAALASAFNNRDLEFLLDRAITRGVGGLSETCLGKLDRVLRELAAKDLGANGRISGDR